MSTPRIVIADFITKKEIVSQFDKTEVEAAKNLLISILQLKKRCRDLGIKNWPRMKIKYVKDIIDDIKTELDFLSQSQVTPEFQEHLKSCLTCFEMKLTELLKNPNIEITALITNSDLSKFNSPRTKSLLSKRKRKRNVTDDFEPNKIIKQDE